MPLRKCARIYLIQMNVVTVMGMLYKLLFLSLAVTQNWQCQNVCYNIECCDIPTNELYLLTTFCDQETACGPSCSSLTYFSADSQRFGCGNSLTICIPNTTNCVGVKVIDSGPNVQVENTAGSPIIDASAQVCQDLFNSNECGYSDGNVIQAFVSTFPIPIGPFTMTPELMVKIKAGHEAYLSAFREKENK